MREKREAKAESRQWIGATLELSIAFFNPNPIFNTKRKVHERSSTIYNPNMRISLFANVSSGFESSELLHSAPLTAVDNAVKMISLSSIGNSSQRFGFVNESGSKGE